MHFMFPHRFNPRTQRDDGYYRIKEAFRGIKIKKSFVVHSAAIENRKVLDSRKNGEWNVKLGL